MKINSSFLITFSFMSMSYGMQKFSWHKQLDYKDEPTYFVVQCNSDPKIGDVCDSANTICTPATNAKETKNCVYVKSIYKPIYWVNTKAFIDYINQAKQKFSKQTGFNTLVCDLTEQEKKVINTSALRRLTNSTRTKQSEEEGTVLKNVGIACSYFATFALGSLLIYFLKK